MHLPMASFETATIRRIKAPARVPTQLTPVSEGQKPRTTGGEAEYTNHTTLVVTLDHSS